ncbi:uncharacterized protein DNG_02602 [Cephalotrichum gorgonifer]|uniref:Uncharacterized protein n=1 Tax=Cephalotrichum gorgonifer TaxID=2041049 RepID=A0AAE8MTU9_9PEZI|nr:uncharacterized protein DNG_02602 [Cephalotrichum gorgonifer]
MQILPAPRITPVERVSGYPALPLENPSHTLESRVLRQLRRLQLHPSRSIKGFTRIPSLAYTNIDHGYDVLDIPTEWNSPQHLQFCGLRPEVAERFYAEWKKVGTGEEDGWLSGTAADECIVDLALQLMRTPRYEVLSRAGDWEGALHELGLAADVASAIMDPRYTRIRELGDPFHWAKDTIETNHDFLLELNRRIRARKTYLASLMDVRDERRLVSEVSRGPEDTAHAKVYFLPLPSHTVGNIFGMFNDTLPGFISSGSELHPTAQHYIHLLKDKSLAAEMASYIATRCRSKEAAIIHVPIPTEIIDQARRDPISWGDWSRLVWFSRNRKVKEFQGGTVPPRLRPYTERPVFEAPVCGFSEERVTGLQSYRDIQALRLDNLGAAYQLVFQGQEARKHWYGAAIRALYPDWVTDVASCMSPTFIERGDISDEEWNVKRIDCWNGWRWNSRPA